LLAHHAGQAGPQGAVIEDVLIGAHQSFGQKLSWRIALVNSGNGTDGRALPAIQTQISSGFLDNFVHHRLHKIEQGSAPPLARAKSKAQALHSRLFAFQLFAAVSFLFKCFSGLGPIFFTSSTNSLISWANLPPSAAETHSNLSLSSPIPSNLTSRLVISNCSAAR